MKRSIVKNLGQNWLGAVSSWPCSGSPEGSKPSVGHGSASTAKPWPGATCPWKSLWSCSGPVEHSSNRCHRCSSPAWPKGIYCKLQSREKKGAAPGSPAQPWTLQEVQNFSMLLMSFCIIFIAIHSWTHLICKVNSQLKYSVQCYKHNNVTAFNPAFPRIHASWEHRNITALLSPVAFSRTSHASLTEPSTPAQLASGAATPPDRQPYSTRSQLVSGPA